MLTDPGAARILCFGDSDTYGTCLREPGVEGTPTGDPDYVRLDPGRRWPGVLQRLLGPGYDVVEEGLNGRTTDLDEPGRPGLNGRASFVPCLLSHSPLDVVVVMLGGNDLKPVFGRAPAEIAEAVGRYVADVAEHARDRHGRPPATILVGSRPMDASAPGFRDLVGDRVDAALLTRSRELEPQLRRVAQERGVPYVDATSARSGGDGVHLSQDGHARLAELVSAVIRPADYSSTASWSKRKA